MSVNIVNGKTYIGDNVSIAGNSVYIDGKKITDKDVVEAKEINISITGDVQKLEIGVCNRLEVTGNVTGNIKTMSGDVKVFNDINGDVKTMSGDVDCRGSISGKCNSMSGDITER